MKKQSKTRAKEQRETEYESFGISLGRDRVCVNSRYYREREREREREKRELLKMLVVEKKDKESVIYKLRTESGSGGAVVALVGIFSVFLFRLLLPQDFLCNGPH